MEQTRNEYGGFSGSLRPIGVVLRGIELRPLGPSAYGAMGAFTCILDGYVVYAIAPVGTPDDPCDGSVLETVQDESHEAAAESERLPALPARDGLGQEPLNQAVSTATHPVQPVRAQYAHYTYREDEDEIGNDEEGSGLDGDCDDDLDGIDENDDAEAVDDASSASPLEATEGREAIGEASDAKLGPKEVDAKAQVSPAPAAAVPYAASGELGIKPYQAQHVRSGRQRVAGMVPPHMELSIRRKMGELGYKDDDLVIFLVERFRKTALHKLKWLDAYKLQQMLDRGEVQAARTEVLN